MLNRHLVATFVVVACASVACSAPSSEDERGLGVATAAVTNVPTDVGCIVISATGNRVAERRFDVVPGASSILPMNGLPVGSVVFRGDAYSTACSALTSTSSPTWVSNPVNATLVAGVDVPVTLPLRRNGSSSVSVDFEDGPDAGSDAPVDAPATARLALTTSAFAFPGVLLGATSSAATFTVSNTGSAPTGALSISIAGADPTSFILTSNSCGGTLAPAATCSVSISFRPTSRGARTATLSFSAAPGGSAAIALSGTGLAPALLSITPPSRDFGSQSISSPSAPFTFVVTNTGDVATGITSPPLLGGANASDFQVAGNTCTSTIAAGATCTMSVRFAPTSLGTKNATLSQNPSGGGGVTATLTGSGNVF